MTSPITKEYFCKIINELHDEETFADELGALFDRHNREDTFVMYNPLSVTVAGLLERIFHDNVGWISYYCWELDFGKNYSDGCVTEADGTVIKMGTPEELYDVLIKNMEDNKNGG